MTATCERPSLTGTRNKFAAYCRDCGDRVPPDGGYLYEKAEGRPWRVRCDGCAEGARFAEKEAARAAREQARRITEEAQRAAEEARRQQEQDLRDRLAADPLYQDLLRMLRARQGVPSYFAMLGLSPPVSPEQVKRAYRCLAKQVHPDAGGNAAAFIALNRSYEEAMSLVGGRP